jgi:ABC-type transporter Mla maintaining outer membrane lipid asymmetry permease subunit MlaE
VVVLEGLFYPEAEESGWSGLGNQIVRFGVHHELVPAFVLVSAFTSRTLSYSAATSFGPFSASDFTSSLAEVPFLGPIYIRINQ